MGPQAHDVGTVRTAEGVVLAQNPPGALMQRAAAGLAVVCARELRRRRGRVTGARVVLLVGAGNNGGDALWAGARLARRGARCEAVLVAPAVHAAGLAALHAAGGTSTRVTGDRAPDAVTARTVRADLVVDGIVGIGGSPGLREPAASLVAAVLAARPRPAVVAVDLPSGVDADGGTASRAHVVADVTVTFGCAKPCLLLPPAAAAAGRLEIVDIGLTPVLPARPAVDRLVPGDVAGLWPLPGPDDDKYSRGVVGVVAGSRAYTGAAVLAVGGALRSGAGMVRYVGPAHPTELVRARWPEVVVGGGRVQAWTLGSGVDPAGDDGQPDAVLEALASGQPAVVDAGALMLITGAAARPLLTERCLLTPHAGELARLLSAWPGGPGEVTRDDVCANPLRHVRLAAELTGATVLLKGSVTVVATPAGRVRTQADAPAWLATAGAGDVLAGVAGTLLAAGLDPLDAGALAALVHGRAAWDAAHRGDPAPNGANGANGAAGADGAAPRGGPIVAEDVVGALPTTIAALLGH